MHTNGAGRVALCTGLIACACAPDSEQFDRLPEATPVAIEYVAHASFLIRSPEGVELLIDPYASRVWLGYDFPSGLDPAAVLITHPHYDHDAGRYRGAPFPWGADVTVVDSPQTWTLNDVTVQGIEGKHADPYGMEFGQLNTIMKIEVGGFRIVHLGDNGPLDDRMIREIGEVDILMIPGDAVYHILSLEETEAILAALSPRIVIPMHYRLPRLESDPNAPSDLGEVEPWLVGRSNVQRLGTHLWSSTRDELPEESTILVFESAPYVEPPAL